jgi:hypothetical protein
MNLQNLSLSRLFSRRKRLAERPAERVEGIYLQQQSFGLAPKNVLKEQPVGTVLTDLNCVSCGRSGAGNTGFVP